MGCKIYWSWIIFDVGLGSRRQGGSELAQETPRSEIRISRNASELVGNSVSAILLRCSGFGVHCLAHVT